MASCATQPGDRPGIDDFAIGGRDQHKPIFGCAGRRQPRLPVLMDDTQEHHPGPELATADQRPPAAYAKPVRHDVSLTRSARAVCGDHSRIGVDGSRRFGRKLGGGPMGVAVPHAPCDRSVCAGQLLKHLHRHHRREIEPAIGFGQKQAEKAGPRQFLSKVFRYPPSRLDTVAVGDDTRSKRPRGLQQRGADSSIRHRCLPPRPAAVDGSPRRQIAGCICRRMVRRRQRAG